MPCHTGEKMGYTVIGKITNSHGVKGDIKIFPLTDDPDRFFSLKKAYIGEIKEEVFPEDPRIHKGMILIRLKGMEDINKILRFKGQYIYVLDDDRIKLPEGRYFISDLIGCEVYDMTERKLGTIKDVLQGAANDVYVIDGGNGMEYLIPAVERFIVSVNIADNKIQVDPIKGMIE